LYVQGLVLTTPWTGVGIPPCMHKAGFKITRSQAARQVFFSLY